MFIKRSQEEVDELFNRAWETRMSIPILKMRRSND